VSCVVTCCTRSYELCPWRSFVRRRSILLSLMINQWVLLEYVLVLTVGHCCGALCRFLPVFWSRGLSLRAHQVEIVSAMATYPSVPRASRPEQQPVERQQLIGCVKVCVLLGCRRPGCLAVYWSVAALRLVYRSICITRPATRAMHTASVYLTVLFAISRCV